MINIFLLLPLALGVTVVAQATLNRSFALQYGLAGAVLLNAAVFFFFSLGFFILAKYTPSLLPEFMRLRSPGPAGQSFPWIYFLPGAFGFSLVLGLPWVLQNIGPSRGFLLLIASQVVTSLAFETYQSGNLPSPLRALGALLVVIGAALVI